VDVSGKGLGMVGDEIIERVFRPAERWGDGWWYVITPAAPESREDDPLNEYVRYEVELLHRDPAGTVDDESGFRWSGVTPDKAIQRLDMMVEEMLNGRKFCVLSFEV
jgi:hypothetical protein